MTTIEPERAPLPGGRPGEVHQQRQVAESFGSDAERYDRARPSYPSALVERIVAASLSPSPSPTPSPAPYVLDVGCGTGIAARLFQAVGCRVLGVDPDPRMADLARRGGLAVEVAKFEDWDPAGRAFDAVIAGQAWHWVDPVVGAAKAAQALRPGGRLAVFWNAGEPPPDVNEAFATVFRRVLPDSPLGPRGLPGADAYSAMCAKAAEGVRQAGGFGEPEQWRFDWDRSYTRDEWLDVLPTFGGASSRLPPATLQELLAGIGAVVEARGGSFTMRYATVVFTAARTDAP